MNEETPVRARPASVIGLVLVTMLALVVAPACAPLCAARTCSSATSPGQCHDMASMGAGGGGKFVAASKACGAAEFSAVLVRTDEQILLPQGTRNDAAPVGISGSPAEDFGSLRASSGRWGAHRAPLESADSILLTTILRI